MTDARAERYAARVAELGLTIHPREMDDSTHTAEQAAAALGCGVEAIVKSLLFVGASGPVLVLAAGPNRVDTALIAAVLGFGGIAASAAGIAKILFIVFAVLAVGSFLVGVMRRN